MFMTCSKESKVLECFQAWPIFSIGILELFFYDSLDVIALELVEFNVRDLLEFDRVG